MFALIASDLCVKRYSMLLDQLVKYSPETHTDYGGLVNSLAQVGSQSMQQIWTVLH